MREFSELLGSYIRDRKVNTHEMADYCHLNLSTLYKIIDGKRKLSSEKTVADLAVYLQLTPLEKKELLESYQIDKLGFNTYLRRQRVHQLLSTPILKSSHLPENPISLPLFEKGIPTPENIARVYGVDNVFNIVSKILLTELSSQGGHINLLLPATGIIRQIMEAVFSEKELANNIPVTHLFAIPEESTTPEANSGEAIFSLYNILPICALYPSYEPYYFYMNESNMSDAYPLFPFIILTSRCAFLISSHFETGLYFAGDEPVVFFEQLFEKSKKTCQKMFISVSPLEIAQAYDEKRTISFTTNTKYRYGFQDTIFITSLLSEELIRRYFRFSAEIPPEFHEPITLKMINHCKYSQKLYNAPTTTNFWSVDGIHEWLRTGRFPEYTDDAYTPFEPADRLKVAETLLKQIDTTYKVCLLKEPIGDLENGLSVVIEDKFAFFEILSIKTFCILTEPGIIAAFADYFSSLDESLYYSKEEARQILETIILRYKSRLEQQK